VVGIKVALEAGRTALDEDEFGAESCRVNAIAREEFASALRGIGLEVLPSAANFLLAKLLTVQAEIYKAGWNQNGSDQKVRFI